MIQTTENLRFGDLISRRVPFIIPQYQRAYAWDDEEIGEFINDVKELYNTRLNKPTQIMPHFFGGIVSVNKTIGNTSTGRIYEVVDGQQRLSTFMIMMAAIVEGFDKIIALTHKDDTITNAAKSHSENTKNTFMYYDEVVGSLNEKRLRLRLSKADSAFFEQLITNQANARTKTSYSRDSHRRLQHAWKNLYKELIEEPILLPSDLTPTEKLDRLLNLRACMTDDCYIIHIVSDNLNEAYRLFAVLNDRGKTLSDGDLLRSYTLEILEGHPTMQNQVEACWDSILSYKDTRIDQFLRSYFPSKTGARAPKRDLATTFRGEFFKFTPPLSTSDAVIVRNEVQELSEGAAVYDDLIDGKWPYDPRTVSHWEADRLKRLINTLKHTLCIPLLLSAKRHLSEKQFAEIVFLIERFAFRYISIVGVHPGRLGDKYNSHAKLIRDNPTGYNIDDLRADLKALQIANASDEQFVVGLRAKLLYSQPNSTNSANTAARALIKHFLTTIDDHLAWFNKGAKGEPKPDKSRLFALDQVSIEHIYPQSPLPSDRDANLEPYIHTIGNLSIWGPEENSHAGNQNFSRKRQLYKSSSVLLNRELSDLPTWDQHNLLNREKRLFEIAKKVFSA